jgi:hypothetical protein
LKIYITKAEEYTTKNGKAGIRLEALNENNDKRLFFTNKEALAKAGFADDMVSTESQRVPITADLDLWGDFPRINKLEQS